MNEMNRQHAAEEMEMRLQVLVTQHDGPPQYALTFGNKVCISKDLLHWTGSVPGHLLNNKSNLEPW